jgi:hypothetical protein
MNTIKTVGQLKKALSVYPDDVAFTIHNGSKLLVLNNDTQIALLQYPEYLKTPSILEIFLIEKE